jgi:hypothetical protein
MIQIELQNVTSRQSLDLPTMMQLSYQLAFDILKPPGALV